MITTVNELIDKLKQTKLENFPKLLSNLELDLESLEAFESWSTNSYTRNCLARCEEFELLLLCWEKGQSTPIHDHDGEIRRIDKSGF